MQPLDMLKDENWSVIENLLPDGWQAKVKELGAYCRKRAFPGPAELLRTLLIHVAHGCSFRVTATIAEEGGLADVTDVALNKRLRRAGDWLRWMAAGIIDKWVRLDSVPNPAKPLRVKVADATTVQEPGSKGTSWRIHYSSELSSLHCDEVKITDAKGAESFKQFTVSPGDVWMGDRCYAKRSGIYHVVSQRGDVLVRVGIKSMVLYNEEGEEDGFDLLKKLRKLRHQQEGDWPVKVIYSGYQIMGRVCAVRKSETAARMAEKKILQNNKKRGHKTKPETLEAAQYICVFTTLDKSIPAETILMIYRIR